MRRAALVAVCIAFASLPAHAGPHDTQGQFEALPCGIVLCNPPGYHQCANPFPSRGYDDVTVTIPEGVITMTVVMSPTVDWDLFVCSPEGDTAAVGANILGGLCDNNIGPQNLVPVGCAERVTLTVKPGESYAVRAFNVADPFPAPYEITYGMP